MQSRITVSALIGGGVLMGLEIAASRLLVPHFGDSLTVWGSLIGIVLIALSVGYYLGGILADRYPQPLGLAVLLVICAISVMIMPLFGLFVPIFSRMSAGVLLGASLFVPPSILLGMISPYCVRLQAHSVKRVGSLSGNVSAASTVGSVLGTFLTTFWLVFVLPTTQLFLLLGGICLIAAALVFFGWRVAGVAALVILLLFFFMGSVRESATADPMNLSITLPSPYGDVKAWDEGGIRRIAVSGGKMSAMNLSDPIAVPYAWDFIGCMDGAMMIKPDIENALTIGIGGGLHQRRLASIYGVRVDAVDINPAVVELASEYFFLDDEPLISTYVKDGRRFILQSSKKYDLISLDVVQYNNFSYRMPFHLATQEFFLQAKEHLVEDGVMMHHVLSDRENEFLSSIITTMKREFNSVHVLDCDGSQIVIASDSTRSPSASFEHQEALLKRFYTPNEEGIVLTDDFAPINPFSEAFVAE